MVEAVIGEAIARAFSALGVDPAEGFTANVVCPVIFDLKTRTALKNILCNRGAQCVTLSNVIDEPLASAVLYGRVATRPPVNKDLLVFDAGAGTVDLAVVRYQHRDDTKTITVLAEQGRCRAGADLDWALEQLILTKISQTTGTEHHDLIYEGYSPDIAAGEIMFAEECEQRKLELSRSESVGWVKQNFLGRQEVAFTITQQEFIQAAQPIITEIDGAVQAVLNEARSFVQDFDGVDLALLVGGTSKLPFIRAGVERRCPGAMIEAPGGYLDELLATVQGIGFTKDFEDLIVKRPPYTTELRVGLRNGNIRTVVVHQAFDSLYDWWKPFLEAVPGTNKNAEFDVAIETAQVRFISPAGGVLIVPEQQFPADFLRGKRRVSIRLDVHANLRIEGNGSSLVIRMPYFAQVGLRPPRPFSVSDLNLPDMYPAEN